MIDLVGHFGTTFSYATVASNVARALLARGLLGAVWNMDTDWHDAHEDLRQHGQDRKDRGSHVAVFAAPFHYLDAYATLYGRERSAIFMSPNTDALSDEHAATCAKFGLAMTPSSWCSATVQRTVPDIAVATLPLGVAEAYAQGRRERQRRLTEREWEPCHAVHFTTDHFWPGRKGTAELIGSWATLSRADALKGARLTIHAPPALQSDIMYRCRDYGVASSVRVISPPARGSSSDPLLHLMDEADLLIAPSRCEGFGMMLLAAVVAGIPLLCTYNTGHADFLAESPGWLGVPTPHVAPMHGEEGMAPVVDERVLAQTLSVALKPEARMALLSSPLATDSPEWGTWHLASSQWADRLEEWAKETT